jgi:hypothetical protein
MLFVLWKETFSALSFPIKHEREKTLIVERNCSPLSSQFQEKILLSSDRSIS